MIEILSYPFMQRALIAALLTGLIAPAIGTYVVLMYTLCQRVVFLQRREER